MLGDEGAGCPVLHIMFEAQIRGFSDLLTQDSDVEVREPGALVSWAYKLIEADSAAGMQEFGFSIAFAPLSPCGHLASPRHSPHQP